MSLIFEKSVPGHTFASSTLTVPEYKLDDKYLRKTEAQFPEVSELELIRHYTDLSTKTYGVDTGFYPLGSCTMKYNPKVNEVVASMKNLGNSPPINIIKTNTIAEYIIPIIVATLTPSFTLSSFPAPTFCPQ